MLLSDTIANSFNIKLFSKDLRRIPRSLPNNNGNSVLPKTTMPWTLLLDISMPGVPYQKTKWPNYAERVNTSNASAKGT
jgi:hypothetical protein